MLCACRCRIRGFIKEVSVMNTKNKDECAALVLATRKNATDMEKLLTAAKADVNAKDNMGVTVLMYAAVNDAVDVAKFLIEAGVDINAKNNEGCTALMYAKTFNAVDVTNALMETDNSRLHMIMWIRIWGL
ncbi:MAG: ankyrin repeat domain-containing protein [Treponemataceae bacterium]|nr:ankyrin repeat domain-containing protein [Treponemataceae bacterium]